MTPGLGKRLVLPAISKSHGKDEMDVDDENVSSLKSFPRDVLCTITSFLDVKSLLAVRLLDKDFRILASTGEAGWKNLCSILWRGKIHVPPSARSHPNHMEAYRMSVVDARDRQHITLEEFTYNPGTHKGTVWSFRFKEAAGPDWTTMDPWYNGRPCRKMVFLENGAVKTYVPQGSSSSELEDPRFGYAMHNGMRDNDAAAINEVPTLLDPPVAMNWRFLTRPLDMPAAPLGSYVRIAVDGRDVPTYCVKRSPTNNWGFIFESCWGVFCSFEIPKRPEARRQRRRRRGRRIRRAQDSQGNWFHLEVNDSEASSESSSGSDEDDKTDLLVDDSHFSITSELQRREAFLYNFGARELPEGDDAVANFDRTYGAVLDLA